MEKVVLNMNDIHKVYGNFDALKGISFKIEKGQIFGYLGPNGSGKTTTIKLILGVSKPTSGIVEVMEKNPYYEDSETLKMRSSVGAMLEVDGFYGKLTGFQNVAFWASLRGMGKSKAKKATLSALKSVKLHEWADKVVSKYSQGMCKRLALARALVSDPDLLILDEPTVGVDPESRYLIRDLIKKLASEGKTIFFSSHDLDEVQKICTHIAILNKGKIIAKGEINGILDHFGISRRYVRLRSSIEANIFAEKLQKMNFQPKTEGPLISFYSENDLDIFGISKELNIIDTWKSKSSLEEVYLNLIADSGVKV